MARVGLLSSVPLLGQGAGGGGEREAFVCAEWEGRRREEGERRRVTADVSEI